MYEEPSPDVSQQLACQTVSCAASTQVDHELKKRGAWDDTTEKRAAARQKPPALALRSGLRAVIEQPSHARLSNQRAR